MLHPVLLPVHPLRPGREHSGSVGVRSLLSRAAAQGLCRAAPAEPGGQDAPGSAQRTQLQQEDFMVAEGCGQECSPLEGLFKRHKT